MLRWGSPRLIDRPDEARTAAREGYHCDSAVAVTASGSARVARSRPKVLSRTVTDLCTIGLRLDGEPDSWERHDVRRVCGGHP
jgi:hypothetical protein